MPCYYLAVVAAGVSCVLFLCGNVLVYILPSAAFFFLSPTHLFSAFFTGILLCLLNTAVHLRNLNANTWFEVWPWSKHRQWLRGVACHEARPLCVATITRRVCGSPCMQSSSFLCCHPRLTPSAVSCPTLVLFRRGSHLVLVLADAFVSSLSHLATTLHRWPTSTPSGTKGVSKT